LKASIASPLIGFVAGYFTRCHWQLWATWKRDPSDVFRTYRRPTGNYPETGFQEIWSQHFNAATFPLCRLLAHAL